MKKSWDRSWATASQWGRNVHVSGKVINSYLVEMGYLSGVELEEREKSK